MEPVKKYKRFTYNTALQWLQARQGKLSSDTKPLLDVSSPPEFKGVAGVWTPEDMFVASAEVCAMSTFLSFGGKKNIPLVSYKSSAEGVLEFIDGKYRFTKIRISPEITVGHDWTREQVEEVVREAHTNCLIANSMTAEIEIAPTIVLV
ncbi:MAG TPA: OsmC family protein [Bacteroidota bacterium]|nr:OsmC family protein [Bacteroidota bacterium]